LTYTAGSIDPASGILPGVIESARKSVSPGGAPPGLGSFLPSKPLQTGFPMAHRDQSNRPASQKTPKTDPGQSSICHRQSPAPCASLGPASCPAKERAKRALCGKQEWRSHSCEGPGELPSIKPGGALISGVRVSVLHTASAPSKPPTSGHPKQAPPQNRFAGAEAPASACSMT
jgi:hypothetical protein